MKLTRMGCYAFIGGVLATAGVTWRGWQFWAVMVALGVACELSEHITVRRCP